MLLQSDRCHPHSSIPSFTEVAVFCVTLSLPISALAQEAAEVSPPALMLEEIVVEAHPLGRSAEKLVRPVDVVTGDELDRSRNGTIGDVLAHRPGVANSSFGPGVGRPFMRGQGAPRVQVLDNGLSTMDASSVSADHAVSVDPIGADQVEIIKGPATLIYGGAASGGVVNVVDDRLADSVKPGLRMRGLASYGSNADEKNAALRVRYGIGSMHFGAQYGSRRAGDFSVPGFAVRQHAGEEVHENEEDEPRRDLIENSALRSDSYGSSAAYVGSQGMLGAAMSRFETQYGIPAGGHEHEHEHEHDAGEEEAGHGHEGVGIDLKQTRVDLRGALWAPISGIEDIEGRIGVNNYQHKEVEPSGAVGTAFDVEETEGRLQLTHDPLGLWQGALGLHAHHRDFEAVGEEAFVPPTTSKGFGIFVVEDRPIGAHRLELGGRIDYVDHSPRLTTAPDKDFTTWSLSAGVSLMLPENLQLRLHAQQSERAPSAEELYAFGPHLATSSFERGNLDLDPESVSSLEVALLGNHGRLQWEVGAFYNHIADYVFLSETDLGLDADGGGTLDSDGEADRVDEAGNFEAEGELLLVDQRQDDAFFYGSEISASLVVLESSLLQLSVQVFGDIVRGERDDGGNLPRVPPMRGGMGFEFGYADLSGGVRYLRAEEQTRTSALETSTPGYDLLSADLDFPLRIGGKTVTIFVQGRNLLDEKIRLSTSLLKDVAPLPGRSIFTGLRFDFRPPA